MKAAPLLGSWGSTASATAAVAAKFLDQQSHEGNKQRATEDHGPVPDIETEKPAVGRHKFELHKRPLLGLCSHSLRNGSAHGAVLLLPA
jgi:hypothetical protein